MAQLILYLFQLRIQYMTKASPLISQHNKMCKNDSVFLFTAGVKKRLWIIQSVIFCQIRESWKVPFNPHFSLLWICFSSHRVPRYCKFTPLCVYLFIYFSSWRKFCCAQGVQRVQFLQGANTSPMSSSEPVGQWTEKLECGDWVNQILPDFDIIPGTRAVPWSHFRIHKW